MREPWPRERPAELCPGDLLLAVALAVLLGVTGCVVLAAALLSLWG